MIDVKGPPKRKWSKVAENMMAPVVANVFRIESPCLIDNATNRPPAAPRPAKSTALRDHPPKCPTSP
eukprot:CAMPEP_0184470436 /NCGR_PEP_ID=MMETSP0740-20130409/92475_1 /TAXON_ID=385413 /ORGANISM="Thalassiosira miniscula, Strain CCMP1093" /LENGTH=66 /DNA_ID=CAMNT_0026846607 /DNA_START=86 /DNA_END=282 /DNA_ORIENTATION=+